MATITTKDGTVAQSAGTREVPARVIPVPDTVSPQMQAMIGQPLDPKFNIAPDTTAEWKKRVDDDAAAEMRGLPRLPSGAWRHRGADLNCGGKGVYRYVQVATSGQPRPRSSALPRRGQGTGAWRVGNQGSRPDGGINRL